MNPHDDLPPEETTSATPIQPYIPLHRLVVLALYASFAATLTAFILEGNLFGITEKLFSPIIITEIVHLRFLLLLGPVIALFICYLWLRYITRTIMMGPERYLDERQQMIRDQAHRNAYKLLIKTAGITALIGLFLYGAYGIGSDSASGMATKVAAAASDNSGMATKVAAAASDNPGSMTTKIFAAAPDGNLAGTTSTEISTTGGTITIARILTIQSNSAGDKTIFAARQVINKGDVQAIMVRPIDPASQVSIWANDPLTRTILFGSLILSFFLMILSLPLSLVSWQGSLE